MSEEIENGSEAPLEVIEAEAVKEVIAATKRPEPIIRGANTHPGLHTGSLEFLPKETFTWNDIEMEFVEWNPEKQMIRGCYTTIDEKADNRPFVLKDGWLDIRKVSLDELKKLKFWSDVAPELKTELEAIKNTEQEIVKDRMSHARKHRQPSADYIGIPREITCCKCGEIKKIAPALVIKRAKAKHMEVEDWVKIFTCQVCVPTKGRKASAKWINFPKEIHCSEPGCTFVKTQHPSMTEKLAMAAGVKFTDYVNSWKCKAHRVKKAHHFSKEARAARGETPGKIKVTATGEPKHRGRVADPKYAGLAKVLSCQYKGCKKTIKQHPSMTIAAAKKADKTYDEFVKNWLCREHRAKK